MKKFLAILLAAMMLLATAGVAFAAEGDTTTYTITIKGDDGHKYEAYQIFGGDLSGAVLSNIVYGEGVTWTNASGEGESAVAASKVEFNGKTYANAADLAEALVDTSDAVDFANFIVAQNALVADKAIKSTENNGTYTIAVSKPGYYFIQDEAGSVPDGESYTKFMLYVVKDQPDVTPKTDKTISEKKVKENKKYTTNAESANGYNYGSNYNDVADYSIGDVVPFALYSKIPDLTYFTEYQMTFHDTMSEGLTFNYTEATKADDVKIYIGTATDPIDAQYYTVTTNPADGHTFDVTITDLIAMGYDKDDKGLAIRVEFTATLNENAVIGWGDDPTTEGVIEFGANINTSSLSFSNNPNDTSSKATTPDDTVIVFTYELDLTKIAGEIVADDEVVEGEEYYVDANQKKHELLAQAEFVLYRELGSTVEYVKVDANNKVVGWTTDKTDAACKLVSGEDGKFSVIGLDDGIYYLEETKAPAGYNLLANAKEIKIATTTTNGHTFTYTNNEEAAKAGLTAITNGNLNTGAVDYIVENNSGATLPETGGIGTTLFYMFGGIMAAGSALMLVVRRRADAEEE